MKGLKRQIEVVLDSFPETRNSDIALMIKLWEMFFPKYIKVGQTGERGIWLKDLFELPREDNIKRIRAKFQNDELKYLPTDLEIVRQRKINETVWRSRMGQPQFPKQLKTIFIKQE